VHQRKKSADLHAKAFNSLICGCDGHFDGRLCNAGNRIPGPEPRPAPANMACFSGTAMLKLRAGEKNEEVAFRGEVEDRGEPSSGANADGTNDVYRIRIWIPSPGETAEQLADGACCTNEDPAAAIGREPDFDDGGDLLSGNIQIHPETPNSNRDRCPVPSGMCPMLP
jgi:hypothetical protein